MQPLAQTFGGDLGGSMILGQRDENVAVILPDHSAVAKGQIEPAGRHSNIVDNRVQFARGDHGADLLFNFSEDQLRFLDARSSRRLRVQTNLPRVDGREKIAAHQE